MTSRCGDVFCDRCGDCIHCYGDDPCYDGGDHLYDEPPDEPEAGTSRPTIASPTPDSPADQIAEAFK